VAVLGRRRGCFVDRDSAAQVETLRQPSARMGLFTTSPRQDKSGSAFRSWEAAMRNNTFQFRCAAALAQMVAVWTPILIYLAWAKW
jgi:hypothetical protein